MASQIPLGHPKVQEVMNLIPSEFHRHAWVGGSAATEFERAWTADGDVDVWVCLPFDEGWEEYNRLYGYLTGLGRVPISASGEDEQYTFTADLPYAHDRIHILTSREGIDVVVGRFDISCHAAAVSLLPDPPLTEDLEHRTVRLMDGRRLLVNQQYSPSVRIISWLNPQRTLFRALKFAYRYGDRDVWHDPETLKCARSAFTHPGLRVGEGL